jgi:ribosomal protein S18 acetylase RimI-like enzyme
VTAARATGIWARALGVSLVETAPEVIEANAGLMRALADGVKRGSAADLEVPRDAAWYLVREGRATVGAVAIRRETPEPGLATLVAVAIAPQSRGRAAGTKALLAAERRLRAEGYTRMLARVPRTNGRGLYFMLRCGYTPVARRPEDAGDTTWFARADAP